NEVRVLCNSILLNQDKLQVDKLPGWPNSAGSGIKFPPEKSLLKLKVGEEVRLTEAGFVRLCEAFRRDREEVLVSSAGLIWQRELPPTEAGQQVFRATAVDFRHCRTTNL